MPCGDPLLALGGTCHSLSTDQSLQFVTVTLGEGSNAVFSRRGLLAWLSGGVWKLFLAKTEVDAILDLGGPRAFGEMEPGWSAQDLRGRAAAEGCGLGLGILQDVASAAGRTGKFVSPLHVSRMLTLDSIPNTNPGKDGEMESPISRFCCTSVHVLPRQY